MRNLTPSDRLAQSPPVCDTALVRWGECGRTMRSLSIILLIGVAAILGWVALHVIPASGVFSNLEPVLVGNCQHITVAPGTEDIEIDEATGQVFISTFDRRGWYRGDSEEHPGGAIYKIDLADPALEPILVSERAPSDFSPHGISLWRDENGDRRLFVVSHKSDGEEVIELFDVDGEGRLFHTESVSFPEMYSPNDVLATGYRHFYATNDRKYDEGFLSLVEAYLALPLTDVVYFDGFEGRIAAKGLAYANGVNMSPDGTKLYVAEVLKRRIDIYDRDTASGDLTLSRRAKLDTAPDNIDVAADGMLYVAGHPKIFDFLKHAKDANEVAPSQVIKLDLKTGRQQYIFVSVDGEINASSVGAAGNGWLFVGAVFDDHVMACQME